jgi:hypothetical protein
MHRCWNTTISVYIPIAMHHVGVNSKIMFIYKKINNFGQPQLEIYECYATE